MTRMERIKEFNIMISEKYMREVLKIEPIMGEWKGNVFIFKRNKDNGN